MMARRRRADHPPPAWLEQQHGRDQKVDAISPDRQQAAAAICITQITTTYDARQDRLRLQVADDNGRHIVLWLTRRLADRVVAALIGLLETDGSAGADSVSGAPRGKSGAVEQLMQQAAADLRFRPAPPRVPARASEERLLTAISLRGNGKTLALDFRWGQPADQEAGASMMIGRVRLRQWMRIMYRVYLKSGWPIDHWPQWISDDAATRMLSGSSLH